MGAVILSGGPNSVYDVDAPKPDPADLERPPPRPRASATAPSSWPSSSAATSQPTPKREYGPATVDDRRRGRPVRGPRADAARVDEPRRLDHARCPRASSAPPRPTRRPFAGSWTRRATCTASSSTPRSHTRRTARDVLRNFVVGRRRHHAQLDARQLHRVDRHRDPAARRRPRARGRLGRQGHLRAVGRRRLGGRGGARPSRGRRSADVHLRRPRADAEARIGAPARDVRAEPGHEPGDGRRARALPRPARRRHRPEQKRRIIGDEFIRVFEEEAAEARARSTS